MSFSINQWLLQYQQLKVECTSRNKDIKVYKYQEFLQKYTIGNRIGQGSFGTVNEARADGEMIAVKEIKIPKDDQQTLIEKSFEEIKIMAMKSSQHIVQILGFSIKYNDQDFEKILILMEYINMSLKDLLSREILSDQTKLDIIYYLANAVQLIHNGSEKISHNDISPNNVLVRFENNKILRLALIDFGVSTIMKQSKNHKTEIVKPISAFTPVYASPQQKKNQEINNYSDVYSVALIMAQMFFGLKNISGGNQHIGLLGVDQTELEIEENKSESLIDEIQTDRYIVLQNFPFSRRSLLLNLKELADKCLQFKPELRCSAIDFYERIEDIRELYNQKLNTDKYIELKQLYEQSDQNNQQLIDQKNKLEEKILYFESEIERLNSLNTSNEIKNKNFEQEITQINAKISTIQESSNTEITILKNIIENKDLTIGNKNDEIITNEQEIQKLQNKIASLEQTNQRQNDVLKENRGNKESKVDLIDGLQLYSDEIIDILEFHQWGFTTCLSSKRPPNKQYWKRVNRVGLFEGHIRIWIKIWNGDQRELINRDCETDLQIENYDYWDYIGTNHDDTFDCQECIQFHSKLAIEIQRLYREQQNNPPNKLIL